MGLNPNVRWKPKAGLAEMPRCLEWSVDRRIGISTDTYHLDIAYPLTQPAKNIQQHFNRDFEMNLVVWCDLQLMELDLEVLVRVDHLKSIAGPGTVVDQLVLPLGLDLRPSCEKSTPSQTSFCKSHLRLSS